MSRDDEFFTPGDIDEQIAFLTHLDGDVPENAQPAEHLVSHLRYTYRNDLQQQPDPLDRAWKRIVAGQQAVQQTSQRKGRLIYMEYYQSGQQNSHTPRKKRTPLQRFGVLAAVLFIGLLIGGMALALNINHPTGTPGQKQTRIGSGGTPFPTPAHPITGGKCTIATTHPHAQQSQSNLPGLYIFASNQQSDNLLYRYNPQTKKVEWSIKLCNAFGVRGTIAQNGVLYLSGVDTTRQTTTGSVSYLYALNQSDGSAIWGVQFPAKVVPFAKDSPNYGSSPADLGGIGAPTLVNNTLYVLQDTGVVYAYNATTGSQLWIFDSGHSAWATTSQGNGSMLPPSSIQVVNGVAYFSIVDRVFALDAKLGTQIWTHNFKGALNINQGPTIDNGVVYLTAFVPGYGHSANPDTYVYAFNAQTGAQKWVSKKLAGYLNAPIAYKGNVSVTNYDGTWYAFNSASGALAGQKTISNGGYGNPFLANGVLYNLSEKPANNTLAVLNADGSTKWAVQVSGAYPNFDDVQGGIIYLSGRGSGIYAYSATNGHFLWHYPGYRPQPEGILSLTVVP